MELPRKITPISAAEMARVYCAEHIALYGQPPDPVWGEIAIALLLVETNKRPIHFNHGNVTIGSDTEADYWATKTHKFRAYSSHEEAANHWWRTMYGRHRRIYEAALTGELAAVESAIMATGYCPGCDTYETALRSRMAEAKAAFAVCEVSPRAELETSSRAAARTYWGIPVAGAVVGLAVSAGLVVRRWRAVA